MNVIILGDPHLGKISIHTKTHAGVTLNSRIVDQIKLLDWTLDQAIEYQADHIIITGDVFEDPKPQIQLITIFMSWLKKCQTYHIHVHIIRGNHDILRTGTVYSSPLDIIAEAELDNTSVYTDINTVTIGVSAFTFVPFRDRKSFCVKSNAEALELLQESLVYETSSIPITYCKVLVGHLAIEGSIPVGDEIDDLTNELFCPVSMFKNYDYVWMGHVHKPQVLNTQAPYVSHIGSMDISNFGECNQAKHIIIFDTNNLTWQSKKLPTRPLQKISIQVPKDIDNTTEYVLKEIEKSIIQPEAIIKLDIVLNDPNLKSINRASIEKYCLTQGASGINSISENKKTPLLVKKEILNYVNLNCNTDIASTIKHYASTYIADDIKSEFIELAMEIYTIYNTDYKD